MRKQIDRLILSGFQMWGVPPRLARADRRLVLARGGDLLSSMLALFCIVVAGLGAKLYFGKALHLPFASWLVVYGVTSYLQAWHLICIARAFMLIRRIQRAG
ncbi:MAG: hypothetical protein HYT87_12860 [Nitrospirae bacterium]|nr:hypothetical protein [Nitrospirota bacterium]